MSKIIVAGICGEVVTREVREIIQGPIPTIVCSDYYRSVLKEYPGFNRKKWLSITPVNECIKCIKAELSHASVVIITSGDPLFFGLGRLLKKHFPPYLLHFIPALSSMQLCFSRFAIPWEDAKILSLHGRDFELLARHRDRPKLFIFTDSKNTPQKIARYLIDNCGEGAEKYMVHVGEKLATSDEMLYSGSLHETTRQVFKEPNCMILINSCADTRRDREHAFRIGLKEEDLFHSRGLITKNEVRAAVLHSLALPEQGILWDIGAGSGSISIESARLAPEMSVYAIEKKGTEQENINKNKNHYSCRNVKLIAGEAPEVLTTLPIPDRVFIGGSGGKLEKIISFVSGIAKDQTIIVLTAVTEKTAAMAPELLYENGFNVQISLISTRRYDYPGQHETTLNPIYLIVARRKNG